jgi:tape measure domain-containing protein
MAIVVESYSDSTQAQRDLAALGKSVGNIENIAAKTTQRFTQMVAAVGTITSITASFSVYAKMSDELTNMTNRLKVVIDNQDDLNQAFKQTRQIALSTGSGLKGVTSLYAKIFDAGKRFNVTQQQSARLTETVAKAIKLSGASATEAAGAILQFGQALSSNRLGGEELRSVMEQTPALAKAIEDGIGKGAGTLRGLAEKGLITFDVIFNALNKQTEKIDNSFNSLGATYSTAFTNLGTAFDIILTEVLAAFGSGDGLATVLNNTALDLATWADELRHTLLKAKSFVVSIFLEIDSFLSRFNFSLPISDFFMDFEDAHQYIIKFLTKVDQGFKWLYDRVIGHSWVPDLVNGVIDWFEKLLENPLRDMQTFVGSIDLDFKRIAAVGAVIGGSILLVSKIVERRSTGLARVLDYLKIILTLFSAEVLTRKFIGTGKFDEFLENTFKAFNQLAEDLDVTSKQLAVVVGGTLGAAFLYLNRSMLPSLSTLGKLLGFLTGVAAFGLLKIGIMYTYTNSKDKPISEVLGDGLDIVINKFKGLFDKVANKTKGVFDSLTDELAGVFNTTRDGLEVKVKDTRKQLEDALNENVLAKIYHKITNPEDNSNFEIYPSTIDSQKQSKISFKDAVSNMIPKDLPFHIATGLSIAIIGVIYTVFAQGPLRSILITLFSAGAVSFVTTLAGNGRLSDYFTDMGRSFLNVISRGITGLFDGNVIKDPFGLISAVAALSIFFEGGRKILKELALGILTSPTKLATNANDHFSEFLLKNRVEATTKKITDLGSAEHARNLQKTVLTTEMELAKAMNAMVGMQTKKGEILTASRVNEIVDNRAKSTFSRSQDIERGLLNNAILQNAALQESKTQLKELPHVVNELRDNKKILNTQLVAVRAAIAENSRKMVSAVSGVISGAGGLVGGVAGFQKGTEVADRLVDATPLQKMLVVVGFSAVGQLVGAAIGSVLVQSLLLFFRGAFLAVVKAPFITGAALLAGALYTGYQLFKNLPGDWQKKITSFFGRENVIGPAQNARSELEQRVADRKRLKASLFDPDVTKEQSQIIRARIAEQEAAIAKVERKLGKFLDKKDANFIERGQSRLPFGLQMDLRAIEREKRGFKYENPLNFNLISEARGALPSFNGLKTNFSNPTLTGIPLSTPDQLQSDMNRSLANGKAALDKGFAKIEEAANAYEFPSEAELDKVVKPVKSAGEKLSGVLENAGSFFKENMGTLTDTASELAKSFKASSNGTFAVVKQQGSVESGLKTLEKALSDVNIKVDPKRLKELATKDLEGLSEAVDRVKDFTEKATKVQKGSFAEKAALDMAAEWKKNIRNILRSNEDLTGGSISGMGGGSSEAAKKAQEISLTVTDQFNIINEAFPKLELTLEEFRNSTDDLRESIFNKAKDIFESSRKLDSTVIATSGSHETAKGANDLKKSGNIVKERTVKIFEARQAIETGRRVAFEAVQEEIKKVRSNFKQVSQNLDALGLTLRKDTFNMLSEEQLSIVNNLYDGARDSIKILEKDASGDSVSLEMRKTAQELLTTKAKEIDKVLQDVGKTTYEKTRDALSRFNVFIQEQVTNVATDAERLALGKYTSTLLEQAKLLDSDDEKIRLAAANTIDRISGRIEEFIFRKSNTVNDAARGIGLNYLNSLNSGVNNAFSQALKGDTSLGGGIFGTFAENILNTITTSIIDSFSKGLTDTLLGNQGALSSGARRVGEILYTTFGSLIGDQRYTDVMKESGSRIVKPDFGVDVTSGVKESVDNLKDLTNEGIVQERNLLTRLSTSFLSGLQSLASGLGTVFQGLFSIFGGNSGGIGGIILNGVLGVLGSLGGLSGGGGMSAGNIKAASAFNFFASGGLIVGPGSGTSDSIPIMASNREFIVNAKSAQRFLPLLQAINSNRISKFAKGGVVGDVRNAASSLGSLEKLPDGGNFESKSQQQINLNITGDISRQTRKEVMEMLPSIANGVNQYNRTRRIRN